MDANPPPSTITWRRKGSLYLIQHSYNPFFGTLQKTATLEDDGDWSCSASSTSGGLGDEFTVIILGR